MSRVAPYGSWESPVTTALITRAAVGLGLVDIDGDRLVWTELRPSEGGRTALVEAGLAGEDRRELTPPDLNVRTLVHEYGGGAARAQRGRRFAVSFTDQRPWLLGPGGPVPLGVPGERHADLDLSPDDRWLAAVCERPNADREHENLLRLLPLVEGEPLIIDQGHDFYSSPCFAPDGRSLAYLSWDHPAMPWDGTTLWLVSWDGRRAGMPQRIAGGPGESIFQPSWSPGGALTFVSDRTGWWNLYQLAGDSARPLAPAELEFGRPQWSLGSSLYGHVDERTIVACATESGRDRLLLIDTAAGQIARELEVGLTSIDALGVQAGRVALVGAGARRPTALLLLDLASGALREIASSLSVGLDPGDLSEPEAISFPSEDGATAHAFFYAPRSRELVGPPGERPPLLVHCHGGPTACSSPALRLAIQFWTSRGLALVDVNYGGSSGYGRRYRERLDGRWGLVDLADCRSAARYLIEQGRVDGRRVAIRGGSAGGFTALSAVAFSDVPVAQGCTPASTPSASGQVFAAAASHYGIADLRALVRDTHKFESRYLQRLLGWSPEADAVFEERSPLFHADRITTPLLILQGLEDKVVPPDQAARMVAALEARGVTHAYLTFPDESHGFRKAASMERALLAELAFYGRVLGFEPHDRFTLDLRPRRPRT